MTTPLAYILNSLGPPFLYSPYLASTPLSWPPTYHYLNPTLPALYPYLGSKCGVTALYFPSPFNHLLLCSQIPKAALTSTLTTDDFVL